LNFSHISPDANQRALGVRLFLMDVDGVMTDGRILLVPDGRGGVHEIKSFSVQDGVGINFAHRAGLLTGIITGRTSESVTARAIELGIQIVEQGSRNKLETYEKVREASGIPDSQIAYIGDDLQDLPILHRTGLSASVANARQQVMEACHLVTDSPGGAGAVRDCIEFILRTQGKWDPILARYLA